MSTGYGWEGIRQVCAMLLGARRVPEHVSGGSVYLGRYNKCLALALPLFHASLMLNIEQLSAYRNELINVRSNMCQVGVQVNLQSTDQLRCKITTTATDQWINCVCVKRITDNDDDQASDTGWMVFSRKYPWNPLNGGRRLSWSLITIVISWSLVSF